MIRDSQGRPVCDLEWSFNSDGSVYLASAWYDDTPPEEDSQPVPEEELEWIERDRPDLADDAARSRFEYLADCAMDRRKHGE